MATSGVALPLKNFLRLCCLAWTLHVAVATSDQCEGVLLVSASPSNVVQYGDRVLLYCTPTIDATDAVSWTKDPSVLIMPAVASSSNPCHCTSAINGSSSSVFLNVTDGTDVGTYVCSLQLSFSLTCRASIQILTAVPPVLSAVGSTNWIANQGSTVTFSVNLTNPGTPLASVVWSKNGVPLSNTSNMVVTSTMLQLSNIQVGDRGQYVVMATNKAGSSEIHFNLFESFHPVVNLSVITSGSQAMLQCDAYGYPVLTEVTIVGTTSTSNLYTQDGYTFGGRAYATQAFMGCTATFSCRASNSYGMTTVTTPACTVGVNDFSVKPVGSDGAFLQWTSASNAPANFTVMYLLNTSPGSSAYTVVPTVTCQNCNFTISGLIPRGVYSFVIGFGSQKSSQSMTTMISSGLGAVTMVTATVVESLSNVISVGWNRTPYASGYLVYVNYGMGGAFIVNITGGDTSSNVSVQCLALNTLQVQAYNSSAFSSLSPAVQVYTYCSPYPAIKSVTTDNSILKITFTNVWSGGVVLITVVQDEGSVYSWSVTLDANGMVCLAGTPQGAGYTVCASFAQGLLDCYPDKVSVGGKGDPLQSCFTPASISSVPVAGSHLDPLVIGIIIVATFAAVATLFCLVGLFLACRKKNTSEYDVTSSTCTSIKGSPPPSEMPLYSQTTDNLHEGMQNPQYNKTTHTTKDLHTTRDVLSTRDVLTTRDVLSTRDVLTRTYNKTFDRKWSESDSSYTQGSCATEV